MLETVVND